ncbi:unnamed protein product [Ectocarpus sp. 12 AP-2014]
MEVRLAAGSPFRVVLHRNKYVRARRAVVKCNCCSVVSPLCSVRSGLSTYLPGPASSQTRISKSGRTCRRCCVRPGTIMLKSSRINLPPYCLRFGRCLTPSFSYP